jgi:hypothetical protein
VGNFCKEEYKKMPRKNFLFYKKFLLLMARHLSDFVADCASCAATRGAALPVRGWQRHLHDGPCMGGLCHLHDYLL